jgi:MioC protein
MSGTAEMTAEEMEQTLEDAEHEAQLLLMDDAEPSVLAAGGVFIICSSTYGQGNVPDNGLDLFEALESQRPDLSHVRYGVFSLGDSTYKDTFCHGGQYFDELLSQLGAQRVGEIKCSDASSMELPEEVAPDWVLEWLEHFDTSADA